MEGVELLVDTIHHSSTLVNTDVKTETMDGYLLLIQIRKPNGNWEGSVSGLHLEPSGGPYTFQRIGTISTSGSITVGMRYRLKRDIETPDEAWQDLEKALRTSWEKLPKDENSTKMSAKDDPPQIQAADTVVLYAGDCCNVATS